MHYITLLTNCRHQRILKDMKRFLLTLAASLAIVSGVAAQEVLPAQTEKMPLHVEYDLAFPGILPDNVILYKLKTLRDKVYAFITADPHKLADFYLLQTDKGMLATAMLVDKNEISLAKQTALKAEHNYTLLTQQVLHFAQKPPTEYFQKIKTAAYKHQEVLNSLIARVAPQDQETFKTVIDFSNRNLKTIEDYQHKKEFLLDQPE